MSDAALDDLAIRNRRTALRFALFALAMLGLAFASVPLYRIFCQVTGFGGTTQRAEAAPGAVAGVPIRVAFDSNVSSALPWKFTAPAKVEIAPGAKAQVNFTATNVVARATTGTATFNVSPAQAGIYFNKIECFCFTEQTLEPGQSIDMPVIFYVDPAIREDENTRDINEITLSYTFYAVESRDDAR